MAVHRLDSLFNLHYTSRVRRSLEELSDCDLVERFRGGRDQAAFEVLLRRHGPMVFGVCRRILGDANDAADAFQATFLIFVRKAAKLVDANRLAPWLYGVATRTAFRARANAGKRHYHETRASIGAHRPYVDVVAEKELEPVLDEEIRALPPKYRAPIVLCCLEGKTNEQAARQLRWPTGTVKGRLARARRILEKKLVRRGVTLPAAGLSVLFAANSSLASVPESLLRTTMHAAAAAAGAPMGVAMSGSILSWWATALLALVPIALIAAGSRGVAHFRPESTDASESSRPASPAAASSEPSPQLDAAETADTQLHQLPLDDLWREAMRHYYETCDMRQAVIYLYAVLNHADAELNDENRKIQAHAFLAGALQNQGQLHQSAMVSHQWLDISGMHPLRPLVLFHRGVVLSQLEQYSRAKTCWQEVLAIEPNGELAPHARTLLADLEGIPPEQEARQGVWILSTKSDAARQFSEALEDFQKDDMPAAEKGLRAVRDTKGIDDQLKKQALFYLHAAVQRQDKHADAVKLAEQFLTEYPTDELRNYVLLFKGISHSALNETTKAKAVWQDIIKSAPDSDLAKHAQQLLDGVGGNAPAQPRKAQKAVDEYSAPRVLPADPGTSGGYVVVTVELNPKNAEHVKFAEIAQKVASFHQGKLVEFDGKNYDGLAGKLKQLSPKNVLLVIPPEKFDINFHRRILLLSTGLDADIFPDFAFGYFTARDGAALESLCQRTLEVHKNGLASQKWLGTAVTSGMKSRVYPDYIPDSARAAGFTGHTYFFSAVESDADVLAFAEQRLPELRDAGVVCISGNGDPEGIWLFADKRNIDRSKHWPYDPARVGHDPKGEMPRLLAGQWAKLRLQSPVVWSGTCHAAATRRVFVEGDIVSTFGFTEKCTVHELDPKKSLCLALLDAGAVAFLAPIAANHGYSTLREQDFAMIQGATLGETIKSTYDDVMLASRGKLQLDFQVQGEKQRGDEQIMQGGGANRVLIGDPALAPFKATPHPLETIVTRKLSEKLFETVVTWKEGFHSGAWDIYGVDRERDWRVGVRIPLDGLVPETRAVAITASVTTKGGDGEALPYVIKQAEPEVFHGRRYLHLQANVNRKVADGKSVEATFKVTLD